MTTHLTPASSFTTAITYLPLYDPLLHTRPRRLGRGVVTFHLRERVNGKAIRLVYGRRRGLPSWIVGLLMSGSVGKAYGRLVKGRYEGDYERVEERVEGTDYDEAEREREREEEGEEGALERDLRASLVRVDRKPPYRQSTLELDVRLLPPPMPATSIQDTRQPS